MVYYAHQTFLSLLDMILKKLPHQSKLTNVSFLHIDLGFNSFINSVEQVVTVSLRLIILGKNQELD